MSARAVACLCGLCLLWRVISSVCSVLGTRPRSPRRLADRAPAAAAAGARHQVPPYELQTLPNGLQVVAVLHHEQPAVTHAAADPRRHVVRSARASSGWRTSPPRCSIRAPRRRSRRADERRDRFHRRRDGRRRRHRSDASCNMVVMKDSFETGMRMLSDMARAAGVRARRKSNGSGSRCCRACRSASRIPGTSPTPCSIGWSTASIPTACPTTARRRRWRR